MGGIKAVLCTCLVGLLLIVLNVCQNYAVEEANENQQEHEVNEPEKKDGVKSDSQELLLDDTLEEEEGSKQDGLLLPTIAPATPVSSSFILISPSKREESIHQSMTDGFESVHSEFITNRKSPIKDSQVDEVEFDSDLLTKEDPKNTPISDEAIAKDLPVLRPESHESVSRDTIEPRSADNEEPMIDIMKFEARDKETVADTNSNNMATSVAVDQESSKLENNVNLNLEKSDHKSVIEDEEKESSPSQISEPDSPDKGILESFKDWKEKQETNGKKLEIENSIVKVSIKKRGSKKTNYASSECGAKVIATNAEAENTGAILNENRDLYMLNPCSCSIWFVIELCEKVSAETIEIANFELFSSTMEKFSVSFSTRYPTREWEYGGQFQGKAERTIQSFSMTGEYYAKFVKVEILSHFGKEHYCPLSLVRVFGRSEVEELDDSEDTSHDNDGVSDEADTSSSSKNGREMQSEIGNSVDGNENRNFLKSATDMVIGLVNKATQSFTGSDEKINDTDSMKNEKQNKNLDDRRGIPKVIQIDDERTDALISATFDNKSMEAQEQPEKNSSETAPRSSSNLVILLDGDDAEEETDSNTHTKFCIFNGEIDLKRCANPIRKFWLEYLFIFRMCPTLSESLIPDKNISSYKFLDQTTKSTIELSSKVGISNSTSIEMTNQSGETAKQQKLEIAITMSGGRNYMNRTSVDGAPSPANNMNDDKEEKKEISGQSLVSPSRSKHESVVVPEVTAAQLMKRKPEEEVSACEKRLPSQPDLSQLISAAISQKNEKSRIEDCRLEISVKADISKSTHEAGNTWTKEKGNIEHVDILITNYDENLGEGKAEVPAEAIEVEPSKQGRALYESNSKDTRGDVVIDSYERLKREFEMSTTEEKAAFASSEELLIKSAQRDSFSFVETTHPADTIGEKLEFVSERPKELKEHLFNTTQTEVFQAHTTASDGSKSGLNGSKSRPDANSPIIEPSFSEPVAPSLGSHTTQPSINYETGKFTITSKSEETTPSPASVFEPFSTSGHHTISATSPASEVEMKTQVHVSHEKVPDTSESQSTSTEQFERQKEEAIETLMQLESSVKIGSGSSGNNKESAILKLKSKVKELASNLSLSTLYLEEMSKRYGTALEEQQKQFKAKIGLLNQTVARNREIINKQQKSIEELTRQVVILTLRLQNLTDVTREHNLQMTERYAFTCMIEAFIIILVLYTCIRGPRVIQQQMERRHSAPSTYNHLLDHAKSNGFHSRNENPVADQRPSDKSIFHHWEGSAVTNSVYSALAKRRRQRRRKFSEEALCNALDQTGANLTKETPIISNTAGVLFSAGKGIFSGLTGAFSKQKKPIASRQARALIDSTDNERVKSLGRSKSLSTIDEDSIVLAPRRPQSYENIRSTKYKKTIARFSDNDKKRG